MSTKRSIYKKNSANNNLVVYLIQRDIFDDLHTIDPIEGVVTINKNNLKCSKIFARIRCTFRYGEEQLDDVLSGVTFYKEFYIKTIQIYPVDKNDKENAYSEIQKRLLERFGDSALPFHFTLSHDIPASITLQTDNRNSPDNNPCGIEYVLQIYTGETPQYTSGKRNAISLVIRKLTLAVPKPDDDVYTKEIVTPFHFHSGQLHITAILSKEIYFHSESIPLKLTIDNTSSNVVRRLKIQVIQHVEITLFKRCTMRCIVANIETDAGFPIKPQTIGWTETFNLRPSLQEIRGQSVIALDGKLKHQDTNLASSTLIKDYRKKESMGIIVQYMLRIKAVTGFGGRDVQMEIPIILCHARHEQDIIRAGNESDLVIEKFKRPSVKQQNVLKETGDE
ncbi:Arrestin red cell isoform 1 [Schistosoma japonicum]|uniref:Arrestin red cell isoform 1 n=1 Tax=Schistosoma japonicum TaxID=6182 RepID=A0A4Z2DT48_SCHJA|nr:Arrestin red cell isoform 1 [Schistosoma japonicum]